MKKVILVSLGILLFSPLISFAMTVNSMQIPVTSNWHLSVTPDASDAATFCTGSYDRFQYVISTLNYSVTTWANYMLCSAFDGSTPFVLDLGSTTSHIDEVDLVRTDASNTVQNSFGGVYFGAFNTFNQNPDGEAIIVSSTNSGGGSTTTLSFSDFLNTYQEFFIFIFAFILFLGFILMFWLSTKGFRQAWKDTLK